MERALAGAAGFLMVMSVAAALDVEVRHGHNVHAVAPPAVAGPSPTGAGSNDSRTIELVPLTGQVIVRGTLETMTANNSVGAALIPPFVITIPQRGAGGAEITGVVTAGRETAISWYG